MKRYIDAYALENRIEDFEILTGIKFDIVHDFVSSQPTADVRENISGEWIEKPEIGDCCYICSECGFVRDAYILDVGNYCPRCGADMKQEKNYE